MAFAFDTLAYSKRLRDAGVEQLQAEAHAEAARAFIMTDLVTKSDLEAAMDRQTIKLGGFLAAGLALLAAFLKLT